MGIKFSSLPKHIRQQIVDDLNGAIRNQVSNLKPEPKRKQMTGLEKKFRGLLEACRLGGSILQYSYEPMRLKIADSDRAAFYKPDFGVLFKTGLYVFYETKGYWKTDAKLRIRAASSQHPFIFVSAELYDGEWDFSLFISNDLREWMHSNPKCAKQWADTINLLELDR